MTQLLTVENPTFCLLKFQNWNPMTVVTLKMKCQGVGFGKVWNVKRECGHMNQPKDKSAQPTQASSQFESGFGGSMFGGANGSQFNSQSNGSQFGGPGNTGTQAGGEFGATSFGGTNAVSQIFKEGGFGGDDKKKKMIVVGAAIAAVVVCLGAVWYLFFNEDGTETAATTPAITEPATAPATQEEAATDEDDAEEDAAPATTSAAPAGAASGNGSTWAYNEESGGPVITVAPGAAVEVSRLASFAESYVAGKANEAGKFRIPAPPPGKVFWRLQGQSNSNEITITPPPGLGLSFNAPGKLASGGQLKWSASGPVAFFRVEFGTDAKFTSVSHAISTSQTSAAAKDVGAGTYFVRVGGFNRASGKWEWSSASSVNVN